MLINLCLLLPCMDSWDQRHWQEAGSPRAPWRGNRSESSAGSKCERRRRRGGNPNSNSTSTGTSAATAGASSPCGKSKEEKPGKSQSSRGAKRDKDAGKSRKDKHDLLQGHQNGGGSQKFLPGGTSMALGPRAMEVARAPSTAGALGVAASRLPGKLAKVPRIQGSWETPMLVKKEEEEEESHRRIKKTENWEGRIKSPS